MNNSGDDLTATRNGGRGHVINNSTCTSQNQIVASASQSHIVHICNHGYNPGYDFFNQDVLEKRKSSDKRGLYQKSATKPHSTRMDLLRKPSLPLQVLTYASPSDATSQNGNTTL